MIRMKSRENRQKETLKLNKNFCCKWGTFEICSECDRNKIRRKSYERKKIRKFLLEIYVLLYLEIGFVNFDWIRIRIRLF